MLARSSLAFATCALLVSTACVQEGDDVADGEVADDQSLETAGPETPAACIAVIPSPQQGDCKQTVRAYQRLCTAAVTGDAVGFEASLADDIVATSVSSDLPWSGIFNGKAGFFEFFGIVGAHTETLSLQVQQYICNPKRPGQLMVFLEEHIKAIATGTEFISDIANLIGVKHGKVNGFKVWEDTSDVKNALTPAP